MERLLRIVDIGAALLVVALSLVHTFVFGHIHVGPLTEGEVWFAGAGAAMFLTGAMNLVRPGGARALAVLCVLASLIMSALVLCFAAATGSFWAWQVMVQLALYGVLFLFSLAQTLSRRTP